MAGLTDLEITYGSALAPAGYRKVTLPDGGQAELNRGSGKLGSFLWYHVGAGRGDPILEIAIVHEEGIEMKGFEKVSRNILKGSTQCAYLYIRRGIDADPIGEIRILYGAETSPDDGFVKIEPSITPTGEPVYLTVKYVSRDGPIKWSGFALKVGDWCDALDNINNWCVAQVVEADANVVKVHFKGWASKWDEVLSRASGKLAELGTHTSGKDTGWAKRVQGNICKYTSTDLEKLRELIHRKSNESTITQDDLSDFNQIREVAETILISAHEPNLIPLMNSFLRDVLSRIANDLACEVFTMGHQQLLSRIFFLDENFSWYYDHYGLGIDDGYLTSNDVILDGPVSKLQKTRTMLGGVIESDTSRLLITNLNHFGQVGGFSAIARLIAMVPTSDISTPKLSLTEVQSFVAIVKGSSTHFTKKFSSNYLPEFQLAVSRRLDAINCDKDLRDMLEASSSADGGTGPIETIWRDLGTIVRTAWKDFPYHERYETYLLYLSRVLLTSPYLNLRIRGICFLNDQIDKIRKKEEAKQRSSYGAAALSYYSAGPRQLQNLNEPTLQWLTPSYLCNWMVENKIMELTLGDPTVLQRYNLADNHDEILKRSQDGLLFLATRNALTPTHLHLLWRSAGHTSSNTSISAPTQSSPSTVKAVYRVLTSLSERLPPESLSLLFDLIQQLTLPLDESQVELLRGVIENATRTLASGSKAIQHDEAGFQILWESLLGTNMNPNLLLKGITQTQIAAADALASILSKSAQLRKTLLMYLEKSVNYIRGVFTNTPEPYWTKGVEAMSAVLGAMQFIQKLVEAQPEASKGLPPKYVLSREQVIKIAEDSHSLVAALMNCLGFGILHLQVDPVGRGVFLSSCMKFLEFILVNSHLELDFEKVQTLWNHFHATNQEKDRDIFFNWLQTILVEETTPAQSTSTTSYYTYNRFTTQSTLPRRRCVTEDALEKMLCRLFHEENPPRGYSMTNLTAAGANALEKLFRHVNGKHARISHHTNKLHFVVNLLPLELNGINILFRAYTQCTDPTLASSIAEFLILLQIKLAVSLEKKKVWVNFTKNCMERISGNISDCDRNLHVSRILQLLTKFFLEIASNQTHSYSAATGTMSASSTSLRISVFWKREGTNTSGQNNLIYMFPKGTVTVGSLRARVAKDLKISPHNLRLMNSGRLILSGKHDDYPLESTGVTSFVDAVILRNPQEDTKFFKATQIRPAMTLAEDPNSEQMYPRKILSDNSAHLTLMFELLSDSSPEVSQSAWDLLDLLPTNSSLLVHIKSLAGILNPETFAVVQADVLPNWHSLVSEGGLLKERYNLMIISSLLAPLATEFSSEDEIQHAVLWAKQFISFGGVHYLFQRVLQIKVGSHSTEWSKVTPSLVLLLQLLSQFLAPVESTNVRHDLTQYFNAAELFSELELKETVSQIVALLESAMSDTQTSNQSLSQTHGGLNSSKQLRKRNRAARYEQYFSTAAKNTSSALSVVDAGGTDEGTDQKASKINPNALVVQYAFSFLSSLDRLAPLTIPLMMMDNSFAPSLRMALVEIIDESVRDMTCKGLLAICRASLSSERAVGAEFCQFIMRILLSYFEPIFSSRNSVSWTANEYFYLLSELFLLCPQLPDLGLELPGNYLREVSLDNFPFVLCELLMKHHPPLGETTEEEDEEDGLLQGLLQVYGSYIEGLSNHASKLSLENVVANIKKNIGLERGLLLFLFNDCLFVVAKKNSIFPRCKSQKSRDLCFNLLYQLAKGCSENLQLLLTMIRPHHPAFKCSNSLIPVDHDEVVISLSDASQFLRKHGREMFIPKSKTGYCGLQNPGCICYMNSTIQQLFMIPEFRQKILDTEVSGDDGNCNISAEEMKDNVLYQLQLLFAYLQESDKVFVEPDDLCASIKDYEGQPTDVTIQQDASEFVSNFFQQLESNLMSTRHESLLKDIFGGVFCNELLAAGGRRSERLEPFFMISVTVGQGKNSLEEGLKSFIAGETVDYTWESKKDPNDLGNDPKNVVKESLPTTKRVSIRSLPDHLIIHLKRFEFDFETMQQIKINQRYSFPTQLNMYPYTVYGRDDDTKSPNDGDEVENSVSSIPKLTQDDCQYQLSGVVVHVGTAHSGHYYSFIQERKGSKGNKSGDNWYEFNDSFVSEFDLDDLEEECFGGEEKYNSNLPGQPARHKVIERSRNAFMLFYDRIRPGEEIVREKETSQNSTSVISAGRVLIEKIWQDNMSFWRTKSIFSPRYYNFLADLLQSSELLGKGNRLLDCQIVECSIAVSFGTLTLSHEKDRIIQWSNWIIEKVLRRYPWCSFHLMNLLCGYNRQEVVASQESSPNVLSRKLLGTQLKLILLDVDDGDTRAAIMKVIVVAMEIILHSNREGYSNIVSENDATLQRKFDDPRLLCLEFVAEVMTLLRMAQLYWRNISVFFLPIATLAKHSTRAKALMQNYNYLGSLLSFFLAQDTPYPNLVGGAEPGNHKSRSMTDGYTSPDFSSLIKAMIYLLPTRKLNDPTLEVHRGRGRSVSSETENWIRGTGADGNSPQLTLSPDLSTLGKYIDTLTEEARDMITSQVFFYRLLKLGRRFEQNLPFFNCALYESESASKAFADLLVSYMKKEDGPYLKLPLRGVLTALQVTDSLQEWRTDLLLRTVVAEMTASSQYVVATETSISMLLRFAKHSILARNWFRSNREKLKWVETWLNARRSGAYPHGSVLNKPRKTSYGSAPAPSTGVSGAVVAANHLTAFKVLLNSTSSVEESTASEGGPQLTGIANNLDYGGYWIGAGYDSDDEPSMLVGKRIKVRWSEQEFAGTVTQYNEESGYHTVVYDTGDTKASNLSTKVWSLLPVEM